MSTHAHTQPSRLGLPAALIIFGAYFIAHVLYGPLTPDDQPKIMIIVFLAVLAIGMLVAVHLLRARREVFLEPRRAPWPWGSPLVVIALLAVLGLASSGGAMAELGAAVVLGLAVHALFVGITEELAFRGVLLQGLRASRVPEWAVMVITSVVFGATHLLNLMGGAPVDTTLVQVLSATLFGAAFYLLRRVTGTLLAPIALHAVWDWFSFITEESGGVSEIGTTIGFVGYVLFSLAGIAAFVFVLVEAARNRKRARSTAVAAG